MPPLLATVSGDLRLWDTTSNRLESFATFRLNDGEGMTALAWNHAGRVILAAGNNGTVAGYRVEGTVSRGDINSNIRSAYQQPLYDIAFAAKSRLLAGGGQAGVVEVWNLRSSFQRTKMTGHQGAVRCIDFMKETRIAAGDDSGRVVLHPINAPPEELSAPTILSPAEGRKCASARSLAVSKAGPAVLGVSHDDGVVRLWDTSRSTCLRQLRDQHSGAATGIEFHPHNPSLVASVGEDGVMRCADTRIWGRNSSGGSGGGNRGPGAAGAMSRSIQIGVGLTCVSFSSDGQSLAVGASDGTVRLLDLRNERETSQPVAAYAGSKAPPGGVRQVEFQPSHSTRPSTLLRSNSNPRGAVVNGDDTAARVSNSANGGSGGTRAAEGSTSSSSAAVAHHRSSSRTSARSSDSRGGQNPRNIGRGGSSGVRRTSSSVAVAPSASQTPSTSSSSRGSDEAVASVSQAPVGAAFGSGSRRRNFDVTRGVLDESEGTPATLSTGKSDPADDGNSTVPLSSLTMPASGLGAVAGSALGSGSVGSASGSSSQPPRSAIRSSSVGASSSTRRHHLSASPKKKMRGGEGAPSSARDRENLHGRTRGLETAASGAYEASASGRLRDGCQRPQHQHQHSSRGGEEAGQTRPGAEHGNHARRYPDSSTVPSSEVETAAKLGPRKRREQLDKFRDGEEEEAENGVLAGSIKGGEVHNGGGGIDVGYMLPDEYRGVSRKPRQTAPPPPPSIPAVLTSPARSQGSSRDGQSFHFDPGADERLPRPGPLPVNLSPSASRQGVVPSPHRYSAHRDGSQDGISELQEDVVRMSLGKDARNRSVPGSAAEGPFVELNGRRGEEPPGDGRRLRGEIPEDDNALSSKARSPPIRTNPGTRTVRAPSGLSSVAAAAAEAVTGSLGAHAGAGSLGGDSSEGAEVPKDGSGMSGGSSGRAVEHDGSSPEERFDEARRADGDIASRVERMVSVQVAQLKDELKQEIRNLHVDMLRQCQALQDEQIAAMSGFEERLGGLVAENQALRAENDRLRRLY